MALESHFNKEKINIKNLVLEKEKEPVLGSRKMYEELKKTLLYDKERKQWNWSIDENQELGNSGRYSESQLLGVLAESLFDKQSAKKQYGALKETELYDKQRKQWNWDIVENQGLGSSSRCSYSQLLGVLVEFLFNKESAKKQYEAFKQTELYDKQRKQWSWYIIKSQELGDSARYSESQLTGILVESLFNKESAKKQYEALKKTELYDKQRKQWNRYIGESQKLGSSGRYSESQLLGVLVESLFDKQSAKKQYEALKKTELYDKQRKQWNWYINANQGLVDHHRYSESQLFGILVEHTFEEKPKTFKQKTPPIPKTRKF